ncbi:MAG: ATP-binding protein [Rhodopila sp.]
MKKGSLRLRLFAAGAASILLALSVAASGLLLLFEWHVERRVVMELEADLRELVSGLTRNADGTLAVGRTPTEPGFQVPLGGRYWQIADPAGKLLLRSRSLWDGVLRLPEDTLAPGQMHRHSLYGPAHSHLLAVERSMTLPESLGGGDIRIVVAIDHRDITNAARAFGADLMPALAVLAAVLITAAWVQVTIGLRPLDLVRRRLGEVRAGNTPRLGDNFPDEVQPLAIEVDTLLEAQETAITRARARAADLAHGLKTPLTVLAAAAEDLRDRGETALAAEVAGVADTMLRHVERELARARSGVSGRTLPPQPVRPVADRVVGVLRRTPRGGELDWQVDLADGLALGVDPQDLAEMLGNLAENAAKWAATRVDVVGRAGPDEVVVAVEDDGPGIAADAIDAALMRGRRLDESRPGTELGLAIVSDLVEAYHGSLTLGRSALGGLRAAIRMPMGGLPASKATRSSG